MEPNSQEQMDTTGQDYLDPKLGIRTNSTYEFFIFITASLSILSAFYILLVPGQDSLSAVLEVINNLATILFFGDFFRSLSRTRDRRAYIRRWGWLDFIGALPFFPLLRVALISRAIRALRFNRGKKIRQIVNDLDQRRAQTTVYGTVIVAALTFVITSTLVLYFESASPEANILTSEEAIWWAFVTITTVGYGDYFPVTDGGRITASVLMIVGVGIFTVVTSYLAKYFISRRGGEREEMDQNEELQAIREELVKLSAQLQTDNGQTTAQSIVGDESNGIENNPGNN
jgi:voltage-gated potassium channel